MIMVSCPSGSKSGYWRSASDMDRPYAVQVDGEYLKTNAGNIRRFSTTQAAHQAGKKYAAQRSALIAAMYETNR